MANDCMEKETLVNVAEQMQDLDLKKLIEDFDWD